jgi:hypothetical protein
MMDYNVCPSYHNFDDMLMEVYLKLLGDPYWRGQALDAILVWYVLSPKAEEKLIVGCKMRLLEWKMLYLIAMPRRPSCIASYNLPDLTLKRSSTGTYMISL